MATNSAQKIDLSTSRDWQASPAVPVCDEILMLAPELKLLAVTAVENIVDSIDSFWIDKSQLSRLMQVLRYELDKPFDMCFDITAIDESEKQHKSPLSEAFTVSYHLRSYQRNQDIRIKVALSASSKFGIVNILV